MRVGKILRLTERRVIGNFEVAMGAGELILGVTRPGSETDHSPLCSAKARKA